MGKKSEYIRNVIIMTATALAVRSAGIKLNMFLSGAIGAEGLGLYNLVMSVFFLASGISVSGMSVAVTRITAQELALRNEKTCLGALKSCMITSVTLSLIAAVIMVSLSGVTSRYWIKDAATSNSICMIALALPFVSASAMLRGWYLAKNRIIIPSLAQLFEQFIRYFSCLLIVPTLSGLKNNLCFCVVICDVLAEFAGCIFIVIAFFASERIKSKTPYQVGRRIADNALPVTASHYLSSILRTVENTLLPTCLVSFGFARNEALGKLGIIQSMAVPLLFFFSSILSSVNSVIMPEIVKFKTLDDRDGIRKKTEKLLGITIMFSLPVGTVFLLFSEELSMILYNEPALVMILAFLAPLVPFMYSEMVCTGILRGLGEQSSILRYNAADGIIRLLLIVVLVPKFGVWGYIATMTVSNILTPFLCFMRVRKITGAKLLTVHNINALKSAAVSGCAAIISKKALSGIPDKAGLILCCVIYILLYLLLILCSRQKQPVAAHRVCLRIPKAVQYISCRQESSDAQAAHHAHRSH